MEKFPRQLAKKLEVAMSDTPVVVVNGPRQSGKTTLVREYDVKLPYYTLDDDNVLNALLQDPMGFISHIERGIIDEVQRAPGLFRAIKFSVDERRESGRFLLTGSANLLTLPQMGDSLAGRMEILTLLPLSRAEIEKIESVFLERAKNTSWPLSSARTETFDLNSTLLIGGYPEMHRRQVQSRRYAWAKSYIKAIVERDVKDISSIEKLLEIPRLLEVLAHYSGKLINFTQVGNQLNLDMKTANKYVGLLENLFLVKQLHPWHNNKLKRIIKTPKLYFLDSGLLASMNKINMAQLEKDRSMMGALLETWVYGELLKMIAVSSESWDISYYRDKDQVEVDFILEDQEGKMIGIDVKASKTITPQDFQSLRKLSSIVGDKWLTGIVLYSGNQSLPFGDKFWAIPLSLFV